MKFVLPTLYKKTARKAVQQWTVMIDCNPDHSEAWDVITVYGQVGGQLQSTSDTVFEGKNLGRKNATTPETQAQAEAKQAWERKKKQGYTESLELARSRDNVLDAIKPMLAHVYADHINKVTWPAHVQPKLDGMRCIAIVDDGRCRLYSRTQKLIETVPHINKAIENLVGKQTIILDGELYNHELKHDFNRIMSIVKRDGVHPDHELVQYHVYDLPSKDETFFLRGAELQTLFKRNYSHHLVYVPTYSVKSEEEMMEMMSYALEDGYEGLMYRNSHGYHYEGKRSYGLLKVKTFRDEEFVACGVEEGNGKLQGRAGAIWCSTREGKRFKVKMQGVLEILEDYLVNFEEKYLGRLLTVKFQNYTPDGIPRFPVGIRFRREE